MAGYSPSTASVMANRLTNRLTCNQAFIEEMHRQGLTIEAIVGEVKRDMTEAMHAQNPTQPDNYNRRAYADLAIKLYGGYAPTKIDIEKREQKGIYITLRTLKDVENITGEKFLDNNENPMIRGDETDEELDSTQICLPAHDQDEDENE
jgi:hypothetical protein